MTYGDFVELACDLRLADGRSAWALESLAVRGEGGVRLTESGAKGAAGLGPGMFAE
jgi:hypothetical protein